MRLTEIKLNAELWSRGQDWITSKSIAIQVILMPNDHGLSCGRGQNTRCNK